MMKNKTSQKATDPTSTSVGTALVQHYWNNDTTKVWTSRELEEAVGDTSSIRSLLAAGHQPFPGWRNFTCETRLVRGGALFRIFNHTPRLAPRRPYGPTDARGLIEAPSPGVLCAVAGVAADGCGADNVWRSLQVESAPLYAAHEAGFATLNGYPVAGIEHAGKYASRPNRLPWVSHMAYDPVIHDHQWNFPDDIIFVLGIAQEWMRASAI